MKSRADAKPNVSRRSFLQGAAAAGATIAMGGTLRKTNAANIQQVSDSDGHAGVLVDLTRCIGCRICEAACVAANGLPELEAPVEDKTVFESRRRTDTRTYTVVNRYATSDALGDPVYEKVQCMHCVEPACASACLVGALHKTPEGPVIYDQDLCIGCRYCLIACPFNIPTYEYDHALDPKVQKCHMCYHRISRGELPGCVAECPVDALTYGSRSDLIKLARNRIRQYSDRYIDHIYGEHEAGGTSWLYISGAPFDDVGLPTDLGTQPFPVYTKEFLSFVPLVLVAWPALLGGMYLMSRAREQEDDAEDIDEHGGSERP